MTLYVPHNLDIFLNVDTTAHMNYEHALKVSVEGIKLGPGK